MTLQEIVHRVAVMQLCENVYMRLDGTIAPTPFKMPTKGIYKFDGQFFFKPKSDILEGRG